MSPRMTPTRWPPRSTLLHRYLVTIAGLLGGQGILVLLLMRSSLSVPPPWNRAFPPDPLHAMIHMVWGLLLGFTLWRCKTLLAGFSCSLFYLLFGIAGIIFENPLGLLLGKGENGFHLMVGAIAFVLTLQHL